MNNETPELKNLKKKFLKAHWEALKHAIDWGSVAFKDDEEAKEFYMFFSRVHGGGRPGVKVLRAKPLPKIPKAQLDRLKNVPQDTYEFTPAENSKLERSIEKSKKAFREGRYYEAHAMFALFGWTAYQKALKTHMKK